MSIMKSHVRKVNNNGNVFINSDVLVGAGVDRVNQHHESLAHGLLLCPQERFGEDAWEHHCGSAQNGILKMMCVFLSSNLNGHANMSL